MGLVTIAIADIGKGAGRMLVITALIAYGATLFSGFLSYFTGMTVFPSLIAPGVPLEKISESQGILPYFSVGIPPFFSGHPTVDECNDRTRTCLHAGTGLGTTEK